MLYFLFDFPAKLIPVICRQYTMQRLNGFRSRYLPQVFCNVKSVHDTVFFFQIRRCALYPRRSIA